MARNTFTVVRYGEERTDPLMTGDHVELNDEKQILVDEGGIEVYSVATSKGYFIVQDGEGRWGYVEISPS